MIKLQNGVLLEASLIRVGDRLDAVRRHSKLSLREFSDLLGVSRTTLHNYIKEERDMPLAVAQKVIATFDLDSEWFLFGPDGRSGSK